MNFKFYNKYKDLSDEKLLKEYKSSESLEYAAALYFKYAHLTSAIIISYLKDEEQTKDAVIDLFEIVRVDLLKTEIKNFKSWLYSVTKNHALKAKKNRQKRVDVEQNYQQSEESFMEFDESFTLKENGKRVDEFDALKLSLDELKDEQRKCVELFYLEKKSYSEIEDITGYSSSKVKSYIQNGKRQLKERISKKINE